MFEISNRGCALLCIFDGANSRSPELGDKCSIGDLAFTVSGVESVCISNEKLQSDPELRHSFALLTDSLDKLDLVAFRGKPISILKKAAPVSLIGQAKSQDIKAVKRIAQEAFEPYIHVMGQMPAPGLETFREKILRGHVWVHSSPASAYLIAYPKGEGFLIDAVAVSSQQRGKGVGKAMIEHAEQMALGQNHELIWLYTNELMHENINLYTHLGYEIFDRRTEDGFSRVYMRKILRTVS